MVILRSGYLLQKARNDISLIRLNNKILFLFIYIGRGKQPKNSYQPIIGIGDIYNGMGSSASIISKINRKYIIPALN